MDRRFTSALGMGLAVWVAIAGLGLRHGMFPAASATIACWTSTAHAHVLALVAPHAPAPQVMTDSTQLAELQQVQHDAMQVQHETMLLRNAAWRNDARAFAVAPRVPRMHMVTRTIVINDPNLPAPRTIKIRVPQPDTNGY